MKSTLVEFVLVTAVGTALALAANAISARGVHLARDYFPRLPAAASDAARPGSRPASRPATASLLDAETERLRRAGFQVIAHDEVVALFHDPLYHAGAYVFVDARDDANYVRGHIPGAVQLDHYRLERHIDEVAAACEQAIRVVAYCNGGDCEDSQFATADLLDRGLDPGRIHIYAGGFEQWRRSDLPVERGARGSGDLVAGSTLEPPHE